MRIEDSFREYSEEMKGVMTAFSGDAQSAADAVQTAYLRALQNRLMLERMPPPAMKAWLFATARNALVDQKRRQARWVYNADIDIPYSDNAENKLWAQALLDKLPPGLREVVELKYYHHLNATEIGRRLHLPPPTVRTRLRKALSLMRSEGEEE